MVGDLRAEPTVSVVVACRDESDALSATIASIEGQTRDDWELVVVDDGSAYEEHRLIERRASGYTVIRQRDKGVSAARNRGLKEARGEYAVCLQPGDTLLPDYLGRVLPEAGRNLVVCPGVRRIGDADGELLPGDPGHLVPPNWMPALFERNTLFRASLFPKALWTRVGGFDETIRDGFEDWEFWIRLLKAGARFHLVPEALAEQGPQPMPPFAGDALARAFALVVYRHPELEQFLQ